MWETESTTGSFHLTSLVFTIPPSKNKNVPNDEGFPTHLIKSQHFEFELTVSAGAGNTLPTLTLSATLLQQDISGDWKPVEKSLMIEQQQKRQMHVKPASKACAPTQLARDG
eukprot:gene2608-3309_t